MFSAAKSYLAIPEKLEGPVPHMWGPKRSDADVDSTDKRAAERRSVTLPARLAWTDQRGVNRFAAVVTRDVSEFGVFVEALSPLSIPLYRLVQFQFEPTA